VRWCEGERGADGGERIVFSWLLALSVCVGVARIGSCRSWNSLQQLAGPMASLADVDGC